MRRSAASEAARVVWTESAFSEYASAAAFAAIATALLEAGAPIDLTAAAGVPTVWFGILQLLDAHPGRWDLSQLRGMLVGGAAAPRAPGRRAAPSSRHGHQSLQTRATRPRGAPARRASTPAAWWV